MIDLSLFKKNNNFLRMWVKARLESETESGICENINIGKLHASLDSWEKISKCT